MNHSMNHPLEVSAPAGKKMKFLQPRFPQIGPAGDGPRAIFCAQSGMGKTSAAMVFVKEYLRIVERVYLISSTIHLDKGYDEVKELIKNTRTKMWTSTTLRIIPFMRNCCS